jgi:FkbH-like protein
MSLTFAEARRILEAVQDAEPLPLLLGMSGTADPLEVFVRAHAVRAGRPVEIRTLPFNTLPQALLQGARPGEREIFLLLPWDFVPDTDWRSGIPGTAAELATLKAAARRTAERLMRREGGRLLYLPAPIPPLSPDAAQNAALAQWLIGLALSSHATVLPSEAFSLGTYLATGCPVGGAWLGRIAESVAGTALRNAPAPCKVLVTDLDNVLWKGVIAEDGLDGIRFGADGGGYPHFIFQTLLGRLRREGVILCAVSRNDPDAATEPLRGGRMQLGEQDFVAVVAGYGAKSAQIEQLAARLNLPPASFVFVDDNPVEIAEVAARLSEVRCVQFPGTSDALPAFCDCLTRLFEKRTVTAEDAQRTELYRRRLAALAPSDADGADLTTFLQRLEMKLTICDRSSGDRTRAVQLINKTTQFNLNGRAVTEGEIAAVLAQGGRLYTATLEDRHGSHGEILACLMTAEGVVTSFAMSCRIFQRRVEHAFCAWLAAQSAPPREFDFAETARNLPFRQFLAGSAVGWGGRGRVVFDAARFAARHAGDLSLFIVSAPSLVSGCA